jgi:hypothetical protein
MACATEAPIACSGYASAQRRTNQTLKQALNAMAAALFLVDARAEILFMNTAARRIIMAGNTLRVDRGCLRPFDQRASLVLKAAIAHAIEDVTSQHPHVVLLGDRMTSGLIARLLRISPVASTDASQPLDHAVVAVVVRPPACEETIHNEDGI